MRATAIISRTSGSVPTARALRSSTAMFISPGSVRAGGSTGSCRITRPSTWRRSAGSPVLAPARSSHSRASGPCRRASRRRSMPRPSGSIATKASRACALTRCRESPGRCAVLAIISSRARPGARLPTSSRIRRRKRTTRPTAQAPILSLDAGLVFEREAGSRDHLVHTLEPRLRYTWIPFRDQDDLPVFDTALPDLNLVQLFRTNRYVGADRLGDANELAAGLTTRLLRAESGQQYLDGDHRPALLLRQPGGRAAGRGAGEPQRLEPGRRDRADRLARAGARDPPWNGTPKSRTRCAARPASSTGRVPTRSSTWATATARACSSSGTRASPGALSPHWQLFARQVYSTRKTSRSTALPASSMRAAAGASPAGPQLRVEPHGRKRQFHPPAGGTHGPFLGRIPQQHFPGKRHSGILPRLRGHPALTLAKHEPNPDRFPVHVPARGRGPRRRRATCPRAASRSTASSPSSTRASCCRASSTRSRR